MIEYPTEDQKKAAEEAKKICEMSLQQEIDQAAAEAAKKVKEEIDKVQQKLAKIPDEIIEDLQKAVQKLMKIINDWKDTSSKDFDPQKIIDEINSLLDPVIEKLESLPVPKIPGLAEIKELLDKLSQIKPPEKYKPGKMPEMPPEILQTIQDLYIAIMSLVATLPTILISLIFDMLDVIIKMFKDIAGVIGVPGIPYPLNLVPQVIDAMPDIIKAVRQLPGKMDVAVKGVIKKKLKEMLDLQIPDIPEQIEKPQVLGPCPAKDAASNQ